MMLNFWSKSWVRYIAVILVSALASALLFMILRTVTSTTVVFVLISLISFAMIYLGSKYIVFKNNAKKLLDILKQILLFIVVYIFNGLTSTVILGILPDSIIIYSLMLAFISTTAVNYFLYSKIFSLIVHKNTHKRIFTKKSIKLVAKQLGMLFLLSLPIFAFSWGLLQSGQKIIPGDPDYYLQIYEAFRRSVLEFNQLPFWNAWVGGGIPLLANIQFGFISVQAPFILLFGTVLGMKVAIVAYQLIAYFGFRKLFKDGFKTTPIKAALLAYIPVFGSFFVDRIVAGHFTFLLIAFVPWLILFFLNRAKPLYWLYFALIYGFMVWSSPHYTTIMSMIVILIWFLYETISRFIEARAQKSYKVFNAKLKFDINFFVKVGVVILLVCFYRMFLVVDFIRDFPRETGLAHEGFTGIITGLYAIWGPDQYSSPPALSSGWGWAEAATYIGIGTLVCILLIGGVYLYNAIRKGSKKLFTYSPLLLIGLFLTFFILGMGNFGILSPYVALSHLPVFDSMRVATRWLMWASLIALFIIAIYKGRAFVKTINVLLFLTVIELFLSGSHVLSNSFFVNTQQYREPTASFEQVYKYNLPRANYSDNQHYLVNFWYDENLYETTRNNLGQVIAGDSLVDTRQPNTTIRCGSNQGDCKLISDNAQISFWSPNKIVIERLAPGPIVMNINPGKGWLVNGNYVFINDKITDPLQALVLTDPANILTLEYAPKLSPLWFKTTVLKQL